jgi:flagellar biosynthesis/type III secretory pathway protein FliH
MSNGIYLTLEQYKDKDLPITITINGHTYHSQFALATAQTTYFEMGKQHGIELGADNTYSDKEMSRMHDAWYEEGYEAGKKSITQEEFDRGWAYGYDAGKEEGYEAGKSESYGRGWIEGHNTKTIKYFDEYSVKLEERLNSRYDAGYNDGYEQCKHDGISKKNVNTESVEQTELSKEYDKGFTKGYAEGYNDAKGEEDYCKDCKEEPGKDEQNAKEIPGEWLSHIGEARLEGYAEGYAEGKEAGFEEGFMNLRFLIKK